MNPITGFRKDLLTGFYAKDSFMEYLQEQIILCREKRRTFSILVIDIDHFKTLNDTRGHLFGDEILKYFSSSIRLNLEGKDYVVFRFGGDEFVLIFPEKNSVETLYLANRLRDSIRKRPFAYNGRQTHIHFSGGVASFPLSGAQRAEELMECADKAMYFSKKKGRGRVSEYRTIAQEKQKIYQLLVGALVVAVGVGLLISRFTTAEFSQKVDEFKPALADVWKGVMEQTRGLQDWLFPKVQPPSAAQVEQAAWSPATETTPAAQTPEPEIRMDTIYLRSGRVLKGTILEETDAGVEMEMKLATGTGKAKFDRSLIDRIERA